jgi:8-oxo-dGTP pyrophosphatase MutT (NUDIX family)
MRRRRRVAPLLRAGYRLAWWGITGWSLVTAPRRRGVKCVVRGADGRVLFVRHTYGDRRCWELPGGGARRSEPAPATARREVREELGIDVAAWRELGTLQTGRARARLELTCLLGDWPAGAVLDPDPIEIAATAWHAPGAPPQPLGRMTAEAMPLVSGI